MIAQPLRLLDSFVAHVVLKRQVAWNHRTAEDELLPDHQAEFVAEVVEGIALIVASAPHPNEVEVGIVRGLQDAPLLRQSDARWKAVERNDVRALCEEGDSVDHKLEAGTPLVRIAAQLDGTKPRFHLRPRDGAARRIAPH